MTDRKDIKDGQLCLELCIVSWICCILIKSLHYSIFITLKVCNIAKQ